MDFVMRNVDTMIAMEAPGQDWLVWLWTDGVGVYVVYKGGVDWWRRTDSMRRREHHRGQ